MKKERDEAQKKLNDAADKKNEDANTIWEACRKPLRQANANRRCKPPAKSSANVISAGGVPVPAAS